MKPDFTFVSITAI